MRKELLRPFKHVDYQVLVGLRRVGGTDECEAVVRLESVSKANTAYKNLSKLLTKPYPPDKAWEVRWLLRQTVTTSTGKRCEA